MLTIVKQSSDGHVKQAIEKAWDDFKCRVVTRRVIAICAFSVTPEQARRSAEYKCAPNWMQKKMRRAGL